MKTYRDCLITALNGLEPEITPLSFYSWMVSNSDPADPVVLMSDPWRRLYELGLVICQHVCVIEAREHDVKEQWQEFTEGTDHYKVHTKTTPVGAVREVFKNGWHIEYFIKSPQDYKIFRWIAEHTELSPNYPAYAQNEELVKDYGIVVIRASRTPAMSINVDWAGTEQFCMDMALEVPELMELYEARKKLFIKETELIAKGPGRFVKLLENLTISMLGPQKYEQLLVPMYEQCVPIYEATDKRVMVHYDGALNVIKDQIAKAPFHIVESLTEAPEGDMTYAQCRECWPDKVFWANINVDLYYQPEEILKQAVIDKRERAGKKALAFEISEDLPNNWQQSVRIVLKTLEELG
jgi:hypothetical protein